MTLNDLYPLLQILADGQTHSGEELGEQLGISRAAVWKRIQDLNRYPGIEIAAQRGQGYALPAPLNLLCRNDIVEEIGSTETLELTLLASIDSTNDYLKQSSFVANDSISACVAEYQSAGKGRRGRPWVAPVAGSITLSLRWPFDLPMRKLTGLSIAIGATVAQTLQAMGLKGHGLKWPNDILVEGKKLAGILVEIQGEMEGPCSAVVGVGLNYRIPEQNSAVIDQPWTDLSKLMEAPLSRSQLTGRILATLMQSCRCYETSGLQPFLPDWARFDLYQGQMIQIQSGSKQTTGRYLGLNADGSLIMETDGKLTRCYGGEVSLRSTQ